MARTSLKNKINEYGFEYSFSSYLKAFLIYAVLTIGMGYLYNLDYIYIAFLVVVMILSLPVIILSEKKWQYEYQRFEDYCLYLKLMKINFMTFKKIIKALSETQNSFDPSSKIYSCIDNALNKINKGESFKKGLEEISNEFHTSHIDLLHAYLVNAEINGSSDIQIALGNIHYEDWKIETLKYQKQKMRLKRFNEITTIVMLSLGLFPVITFKFYAAFIYTPVIQNNSYQILTFVVFLLTILQYTFIHTILNDKWLREDD